MKYLLCVWLTVAVQIARAQLVDLPRGCFTQKKFPCQVRVTSSFLAFDLGLQKFHLGAKSSLLFISAEQIQLLQGDLWIQQSDSLGLKFSPALKMVVSGEWLIRKAPQAQTHVFNLAGQSKFDSQFVFPSESVPVGFQNWYGLIDSNGEISRGVIRPIQIKEFLKTWIPLSGLSMAEIRKSTLSYREAWGDSLERSAKLYQEIVERRLASHEDKALRLQDKRRQAEIERAQLRRMFRERNGLPPK
jgi:hypothetical protein